MFTWSAPYLTRLDWLIKFRVCAGLSICETKFAAPIAGQAGYCDPVEDLKYKREPTLVDRHGSWGFKR